MALAEQPLKKRKLYEPVHELQSLHQSFVPPLSQDEILRKRRNTDEIRGLYDCYRRIKYCISQKDARLMPDFEQAYLSLITASRGCTSGQRILSELIPRYASHCPTALEAAAKVAINMYNWNFATILRGGDSDGVAFQTAKACIFGLVDICGIASSEAPTSSVIGGICSAVFLNVLNFFVSSFEGNDICEIGIKNRKKIQDPDFFQEMKQEVADEHESTLSKLFKLRVLILLRIFFCHPKKLLEACFETFKSREADAGSYKCGNYFLRQVTKQTRAADVVHISNNASNEAGLEAVYVDATERVDSSAGRPISDDFSEETSQATESCLVEMAFSKDQSLRHWLLMKYGKLSKSVNPQTSLEISSALEEILGSFSEQIKEADDQDDSDVENSDSSIYINRQYLMSRISSQHEGSVERSERDQTSRVRNASAGDALIEDRNPADKLPGRPVKFCGLITPLDLDILNERSNHEVEGSRSIKDLEIRAHEDSCQLTPSMKKDSVTGGFPSPVNKAPLELRNEAFEGGKHLQAEKNHVSNAEFGFPAMRPTSESAPNAFASPEPHSSGRYNSFSSNKIGWYFDGDPEAMDVFSASNQLWLGSLGPDASESLVKFQFEKFGPVELFLFFPMKGFALVEYRNIMDAIKARECMRGSSPWGACLQVKFLDAGLGSRGSINGVAIGHSCHVYVGNVSNQWIKDDLLQGLMRSGFRHPRMVSDLTSESALLMELETAEEATVVMAYLRQFRKENGYHVLINTSQTLKASKEDVSRSYMNGTRFVHAPIQHEFRSVSSGSMPNPNSMIGFPHVPNAFDSPLENRKFRMSQLSSLLQSLSSKYNISPSTHSIDNHISRRYHATATRDEDRVPTNTLRIGLPDISSPVLADDELMAVCSQAVGNAGSVVRLTRATMQTGFYWFVELNSVDAAITAMKNFRSCPGMFFQIEFSQPGSTHSTNIAESSRREFVSSRMEPDTHGTMVQSGHVPHSNWVSSGCREVPEVGVRNIGNFNGYDNNAALGLSQASHSISHVNEQIWTYKKPEMELQFSSTQGLSVPPTQQTSSFMRPVYFTPNSLWDTHNVNHPFPMGHINPSIMPNNFHNVAPPFLSASVTPLGQLPGSAMHHLDQMVGMSAVSSLSAIPPPPSMPPPLPPSPPPLPISQPPLVPPPPSSPPPHQSAIGSSNLGNTGLQHQWQGVLCKSGVHYCKIYAHRENSDACKYSNAIPEPTGWPARLDVTKRTDFPHVKLTFTSTPPHRREVCRLFPYGSDDHKGFEDFIWYLKQRECAGVIKIPAVKKMWARLLFILPYSHDTCSMLGIAPHPSESLIGLILPKETSFEWV